MNVDFGSAIFRLWIDSDNGDKYKTLKSIEYIIENAEKLELKIDKVMIIEERYDDSEEGNDGKRERIFETYSIDEWKVYRYIENYLP